MRGGKIIPTYDVIIVGGGPIGSIAGSLVAREGFRVMIIEKQTHPRWKPCGECISMRGIELLKQFDLFEPIQNILWEISGVSINMLQENIATKRHDKPVAYTLDRADFDHKLFKYAQELGAETHESEKVIDVTILNENEISVKTTQKNYKSKVIIGADGVYSIVGRKLFRQWKRNEIAPCQVSRYKIPKKHQSFHPATMEYHFLKGGYGWVFPRVQNDQLILNIGMGKTGEMRSSPDTSFNNFIKSLETEKKVKLKGREIDSKIWSHPIPTEGPSRGTYSDCCLLVGDAGGFVNPLTGGGLRYGALSAVHAAETTTQFLDNKIDTLASYKDKWSEDIKHIFNDALKSREALYFSDPTHLLTCMNAQPNLKKDLFKAFLIGTA